jgi:hypothetical protein
MNKKIQLLILALFVNVSLFAQDFLWRAENQKLISPTVFQVDIYMYNIGTIPIELLSGNTSLYVNTAFRNGGAITASTTTGSGSSDLIAVQQPGTAAYVNGTTVDFIRRTITSRPVGSGTTILPGTRVKWYTLVMTNTLPFSTTVTPNLAFKFTTGNPATFGYTNPATSLTAVGVSNTVNVANWAKCFTATYWTGSSWVTGSVTAGTNSSASPTANDDVVIFTGTLPSGNLTCRNYDLNAGAIHNLSANTLNVGYNLINNGTLNATTSAINLTGTLATQTDSQTVTGTSLVSAKSLSLVAGTRAYLGTSVNVIDSLNLTSRRIFINNNNLTLNNNATIYGANSTAYVVTDSAGSLVINNVGTGGKTGTILFPVGTSTSYNPISITNDSIADNYWVSVKTGIDAAGASLTTNAVNRKWSIKEAVSGGSKLTVNLQWNSADELPSFARALSYVSMVDSTGRWIPSSALAAVGAGPFTQTLSGITALSTFGSFGVGSNNALPISLLSFGGNKKANSVVLNWRTAAEINSKEFQIERLDLNNKFVKIGTVKASGNSNKVLVYNFTDFDILVNQKVSFYRLKMVDLDGTFKYSNIIKISDENGPKVFTVFPNPSVGKLNIESNNINLAASTYKITNIIGETIKIGNSAIEEIDVNNLAAGVYMITLVDSTNESVSVKFVKQ